jgi:drug/metabolite transporter (DMT)-like permease
VTRSNVAIGIALAVGTIVLFSLKGIFTKFAYHHGVDALSMMGLRMAFSLPFFVAVALWLQRDARLARLGRRDFAAIAGLGVLGYYVASQLDFIGLQYVTAGMERVLLFVFPTIVVVLSAVFLGKTITRRDVISLVLTYAGVVLVVSGAIAGEQKNIVLGALFVFGSALGYAIYLVAGTETIKRVGALRFTAYGMIAASVPAIVQWVVLRPAEVLSLPAPAYGWTLLLAVFSTVLPLFMQAGALKRIGANQFALIGALGPVVTILVGYVTLGERMSAVQWAGAVAVIVGVMIVTLKPAAAKA